MIDQLYNALRVRLGPDVPFYLGARHTRQRQGGTGIVLVPLDDAYAEIDRALLAMVRPPLPRSVAGTGVARMPAMPKTMRAVATKTSAFEAWCWAPSVEPRPPFDAWGDPLRYGEAGLQWGGARPAPEPDWYGATEFLVAKLITSLRREVGLVSLQLAGGTWAQEDEQTTGAAYRLRFAVRAILFEARWQLGMLDGIEQICVWVRSDGTEEPGCVVPPPRGWMQPNLTIVGRE